MTPDARLTLYGKSRGKPFGPDLHDDPPKLEQIIKLSLSRILPQSVDHPGFLWGPIVVFLKIVLSRAYEVIDFSNHVKPLVEVDKAFASLVF